MVTIDVLRKLSYDNDSPWAAPTFTQPKKTGDIRILTDFRKLNVKLYIVLKRRSHMSYISPAE